MWGPRTPPTFAESLDISITSQDRFVLTHLPIFISKHHLRPLLSRVICEFDMQAFCVLISGKTEYTALWRPTRDPLSA